MPNNKTVLILGASTGIGSALAIQYSLEVDQVIICGRSLELLLEIANTSNRIQPFYFDATRIDEIENNLNFILKTVDKIDLIINCIGIGELNPHLNSQLDLSMIQTNVQGFTLISNWAFTYLKRQNQGRYASISSIGGIRGSKDALTYNASKAYQINYLEGLQIKAFKECPRVKITEIRPGLVATNMAKGDGLFWVMPVEKVAKQIKKGIGSNSKVIIVTKRWRIISLLLQIIPRQLLYRL